MLLSERYGTLRVRRRPLSAHGQNSQRDIENHIMRVDPIVVCSRRSDCGTVQRDVSR